MLMLDWKWVKKEVKLYCLITPCDPCNIKPIRIITPCISYNTVDGSLQPLIGCSSEWQAECHPLECTFIRSTDQCAESLFWIGNCFIIWFKLLFWVLLSLQVLRYELKRIYCIPLSTLGDHSPIQKSRDLLRDFFLSKTSSCCAEVQVFGGFSATFLNWIHLEEAFKVVGSSAVNVHGKQSARSKQSLGWVSNCERVVSFLVPFDL